MIDATKVSAPSRVLSLKLIDLNLAGVSLVSWMNMISICVAHMYQAMCSAFLSVRRLLFHVAIFTLPACSVWNNSSSAFLQVLAIVVLNDMWLLRSSCGVSV